MDNSQNNPNRENGSEPKNGAQKPFHHHSRRRKPQDAPKTNPAETKSERNTDSASPNGQITTRAGRYDLPADAAAPQSRRPEGRPSAEKSAQNRPDDAASGSGQTPRRDGARNGGPRHSRHSNKPRTESARQEQDPAAAENAPQPVKETDKTPDAAEAKQTVQGGGQKPKRPDRNRRPQKRQSESAKQDAPVKQDTPRAELQTAETSENTFDRSAAPAEGDGAQKPHSRPAHRRGSRHRNGQNRNPAAEAVQPQNEAAETAPAGEYTISAGIAASEPEDEDAAVRDELNALSPGELSAHESEPGEYVPIIPDEPAPPVPTIPVVGVRFKPGGKIYYFNPGELTFSKGDPLIVETARGMEYGVCELSNRLVTEREVVLPLRTVVRAASDEDTERHDSNEKRAKEAFGVCVQKIAEHRLKMKLIDVEYTFDNAKLLFYFTADGRVDFRELVKDLASVFRTRIELRQIGIRDETRMLGGIGICGRPFCCKTFLGDFVQVSIKMAKEQNLSLNSLKISGACGRLMCCLRYEYDTYYEEIRRTPRVDQIVSTPAGDGTVIEVQPLAGLVRVRFLEKPDAPPKVFHRDDVKVIGGKGFKPAPEQTVRPESDSRKNTGAPSVPEKAPLPAVPEPGEEDIPDGSFSGRPDEAPEAFVKDSVPAEEGPDRDAENAEKDDGADKEPLA